MPVVDFERESFMPGGAANVARNLTALDVPTELFGVVGHDHAAQRTQAVASRTPASAATGLLPQPHRPTSVKTRIVAHKQQVVRIDRETRDGLDEPLTRRLICDRCEQPCSRTPAAVIVGDYGKGVVTQALLEEIKLLCRSARHLAEPGSQTRPSAESRPASP